MRPIEPATTATPTTFVEGFEHGFRWNRAVARYGIGRCLRAAALQMIGEGPHVIRLETDIATKGQPLALAAGRRLLDAAWLNMDAATLAEWFDRWDVPTHVRSRYAK